MHARYPSYLSFFFRCRSWKTWQPGRHYRAFWKESWNHDTSVGTFSGLPGPSYFFFLLLQRHGVDQWCIRRSTQLQAMEQLWICNGSRALISYFLWTCTQLWPSKTHPTAKEKPALNYFHHIACQQPFLWFSLVPGLDQVLRFNFARPCTWTILASAMFTTHTRLF